MGNTPFRELLFRAWNLSFSSPVFFWLGSLLALTTAVENFFPLSPFKDNISLHELLSITELPENFSSWIFLACGVFLIRAFGTGNLIIAITKFQKHFPTKSRVYKRSLFKNFSRTFFLEMIVLLFLFGIAFVLFVPILFALQYNESAIAPIASGGLFLFTLIAIIAFFIQKFGLFYRLLSPLRWHTSLEKGATLFSKNTRRCLLFGVLYCVLFILFTFCLNVVMLNIVAITQQVGFSFIDIPLSLALTLPCFAWWSVFGQSLWLLFFQDLATPKIKEKARKASLKEGLPESPLA